MNNNTTNQQNASSNVNANVNNASSNQVKGPAQQAPVGPGNPPGPADMKSYQNNPGAKAPGTGSANNGSNSNNNNSANN